MGNQYCADLNDLFEIFKDHLSAADIVAAKTLGEISAAIVRQRLALGMTQKQFAEHMDVSQAMVSKWESTDYNFSVKTLAEIASKLDLDLNVRLCKSNVFAIPEVGFTRKPVISMNEHFYVTASAQNQSEPHFWKCRKSIKTFKIIVNKEEMECYSM